MVGGIVMRYCLQLITKDGDVTNHYFSSYEDLEYNTTYCQFSTNIIKAIGLRLDFLKTRYSLK